MKFIELTDCVSKQKVFVNLEKIKYFYKSPEYDAKEIKENIVTKIIFEGDLFCVMESYEYIKEKIESKASVLFDK